MSLTTNTVTLLHFCPPQSIPLNFDTLPPTSRPIYSPYRVPTVSICHVIHGRAFGSASPASVLKHTTIYLGFGWDISEADGEWRWKVGIPLPAFS